jgi:hypothetical protein
MDFDYCLRQLSANAAAIQHLVAGVDDQQAMWKPDTESWSILEAINHLADEEREDFRARLRFVLANVPGDPPAIDPINAVKERRYNERNLGASLVDFLAERENSLIWLRDLKEPNWDSTYTASWGSIRSGDLLAAWVAHDLLHLRQLVELKWAYGLKQYTPYKPDYAGDW